MRRIIAQETIDTETKSWAIPTNTDYVSVVVEPTSGDATCYAELAPAGNDSVTSNVEWDAGTVTAQASTVYVAPISRFIVVASGACKVLIAGGDS